MQVDDSTCLTGGTDSTIRMWDLRMVGEEDQNGTLGDIPEIVNYSDALSEGGSSKIRDGSVGGAPEDIRPEDGACVRVLEGHSKAVSALYFEDTCLVSYQDQLVHQVVRLLATQGFRCIRQDSSTMGPIYRPVRPYHGYLMGYLASTITTCFLFRLILERQCQHHIRSFRFPYTTLCGRQLGNVPGLCWSGTVLGLCVGQWKRRWLCKDVGYADRPSPSDARWSYRTSDFSPIRRDACRQWELGQEFEGKSSTPAERHDTNLVSV